MSNRVEPEIPTITLDRDQVKLSRGNAEKTAKIDNLSTTTSHSKSSFSLVKSLVLFIPYIALIGGGWYFYQQQNKLTSTLDNSVQRILQLENQLSATGEEMGESTIALKVKLEAVSGKTELLLTEMDKLWASAWRKNQKEIKELNSKNKKFVQIQNKNTNAISTQSTTVNDLHDKITATEFSINAVSEQIIAANTIKDELSKLSSKLNTLEANAKSRDKQQMFTATSVNEIDTALQLVLERIEGMEAKKTP